MSGLLTQLVPVISALGGLAALLMVFADRRTRAATAKKAAAEGDKAGAEGQVALSGQTLEWARDYRTEAKEAKQEAASARAEARTANERADGLQRDRDNDRELIADLRRDRDNDRREFDALLERIAACPAGSVCPVADGLTRGR